MIDFQNPDLWKNNDILLFLKTASIKKKENIDDFFKQQNHEVEHTQDVYIITFENNIKGIFKPLKQKPQSMYSEVSAYNASCYLTFPYVPPTIIRKIDDIEGSLQLFVDAHLHKQNTTVNKKLSRVSQEAIIQLKTFYFLFGQWDTWSGNILEKQYNGIYYLICIDNEHIITNQHVRYGESPFVKAIQSYKFNTNDFEDPFPFDSVKEIIDPTREKIRETFGSKLPNWWYDHIHVNLFKKQPFRYVIYQNALWRQRYIGDTIPDVDYVSLHVPHITSFVKRQIESLTEKSLIENIFNEAYHANLVDVEYVNSVLNRRNMILANATVVD
jgi:hypothetical protein